MSISLSSFDLTGRVVIITGGAGLLGRQHADAVAELGGIPVLVDVAGDKASEVAREIEAKYAIRAFGLYVDITNKSELELLKNQLLEKYGRIDVLINNAANNPKVSGASDCKPWSRLENFPMDVWERDLAVGLTGSFLCAQVFGTQMACNKKGVILNISSDLGIIAPDQRIYRKPDLNDDQQPVKPVTYSVVKTALLGLTRYLATYWSQQGVRVNALCPGGVETDQPEEFKDLLHARIPMGRMARADEYKGAVQFLISDASSYMTGAVLSVDGGRTCW